LSLFKLTLRTALSDALGYVNTDKRQEVLRRLAASKCACDRLGQDIRLSDMLTKKPTPGPLGPPSPSPTRT
jgi:hypothetical protein